MRARGSDMPGLIDSAPKVSTISNSEELRLDALAPRSRRITPPLPDFNHLRLKFLRSKVYLLPFSLYIFFFFIYIEAFTVLSFVRLLRS